MVPFVACMLLTARFYGLPPRVLPVLQSVEGGRPGLVHMNRDGSQDLGLMQINTRWLDDIAEAVRAPRETVRAALVNDGCFSIRAAGAILSAYRREARGNLMMAIGYYHSHTPPLNQAYQAQVWRRAAALFGG